MKYDKSPNISEMHLFLHCLYPHPCFEHKENQFFPTTKYGINVITYFIFAHMQCFFILKGKQKSDIFDQPNQNCTMWAVDHLVFEVHFYRFYCYFKTNLKSLSFIEFQWLEYLLLNECNIYFEWMTIPNLSIGPLTFSISIYQLVCIHPISMILIMHAYSSVI